MTTIQTKQLNGLNGGRPQKLSRTLATEICSTLAHSTRSLPKLCEQRPSWPSYHQLICERDRKPWFRDLLTQARAQQADALAMETLEVVKDTYAQPENMAKVQAAKLLCENTRWYASKLMKSVYGEESAQVNVDARTAVIVGDEQLKDLRSRLNEARALVRSSDTERALPPSETDHATKLRAK